MAHVYRTGERYWLGNKDVTGWVARVCGARTADEAMRLAAELEDMDSDAPPPRKFSGFAAKRTEI